MIATVSTIKDSLTNVQRFVTGNLAGGVDHLVVFLDEGDPAVEDWLSTQPQVTHVVADQSWWRDQRPEDLNNRQRINANLAKALFTVVPAGVDWLFHIDGDEIAQISHAALDTVPASQGAARLLPMEAVSRKTWDSSPTWFKRLLDDDDLTLLHTLGVIERPANTHLFHGHVEGKVGVRPSLDQWLTLHRVVGVDREPLDAFEHQDLGLLHYESYSGEDFVRKWNAILSAGTSPSLRKVRQLTARSVLALQGKEMTEELRATYLMKIFERTTEDDFETLRDLQLLVEVDPSKGTHVPTPMPAEAKELLESMLAEIASLSKRPFDVCVPRENVLRVLRKAEAGSSKADKAFSKLGRGLRRN